MLDPTTIEPNGKALLNNALPGTSGGHVLAVRELHNITTPTAYITEHLAELKAQHNVGTIGLESPSFLMPFVWAYRDARARGSQGDINAAHDLLVKSYKAFGDERFQPLAEQRAALTVAAIDQGINVIHFDARQALNHSLQYYADKMAIFKSKEATTPLEQLSAEDTYLWVLNEADKLCKAHPAYRKRLDTIETMIVKMIGERIPSDVISATIATQTADAAHNMITFSGMNHLNGIHVQNPPVDGIFDEGLANAPIGNHAHWKVTDGYLLSRKDNANTLKAMIEARAQGECLTHDHSDFTWMIDQDDVVYPPTAGKEPSVYNGARAASLILSVQDPCADIEATPEQVFTATQLNPSQSVALKSTIAALHSAFTTIDAKGPVSKPKSTSPTR